MGYGAAKRLFVWIFAALSLLALGCSPPRVDRFAVPAEDGETSLYEERRPDGVVTGYTKHIFRKDGDGWVYVEEKAAPEGGEPKSATFHIDDRFAIEDAAFADGRRITREGEGWTGTGEGQAPIIAPCPDCVENALSVEALRGIELPKPGERRVVRVLDARSGVAVQARVKNVGRDRVQALGATVEATHLELAFLVKVHHVWIDDEKRVVRYRNASGGELVLRDWSNGRSAEHAAIPLPSRPEVGRPVVPLSNIAVALVAQGAMVLGPFALAAVLRRRWKISYRLWGLGALAFIGSQVVHIPLNWAIGILTGSHGAGLWPLPAFSVVAGLSAGACETVARLLMIRFAIRERDDRAGLFIGAGHGGIESILLGFLAATGTLTFAAIRFFGPAKLGIQPEQLPPVDAAMASFAAMPAGALLSAATERFGAVAFHMFANLLVMRAVRERQALYVVLAIAIHALIDGGLACFGVVELGAFLVGVSIPALGVAFIAAMWWMLRPSRPTAA